MTVKSYGLRRMQGGVIRCRQRVAMLCMVRRTLISSLLASSACSIQVSPEPAPPQSETSAEARGAALIAELGCGACHTIPGIRTARGRIGPPLQGFTHRVVIAGHLPNTPANLTSWIRDAPAINPRTAMPAFDIENRQAGDIAAFLYTLR